jgi:hypothetical protein
MSTNSAYADIDEAQLAKLWTFLKGSLRHLLQGADHDILISIMDNMLRRKSDTAAVSSAAIAEQIPGLSCGEVEESIARLQAVEVIEVLGSIDAGEEKHIVLRSRTRRRSKKEIAQ